MVWYCRRRFDRRCCNPARRAEGRSEHQGAATASQKDRSKLRTKRRANSDELVAHIITKKTAGAWLYREQLPEIMPRRQPNVVRPLPKQRCTNAMRSKVDPMKEVAGMIRDHFEGILYWVTMRQTNLFLQAINGLFQAAKRRARGYVRFRTICTVIFLIARQLHFSRINPYAPQPT
jgi:transposase